MVKNSNLLLQNITTNNSKQPPFKFVCGIFDCLIPMFPLRHRSSAAVLTQFFKITYVRAKQGKSGYFRARQKRISATIGYSLRTVQTAISRLLNDGFIFRKKSKLSFSDFYQINFAKVQEELDKQSSQPVGGDTHTPPKQLCTPLSNFAHHLYSSSDKEINQEQEVIENQFSFNKKRIVPKPILKTEKQKKKKQDLVVGQQEQKLDNGHHTNLLNKNIHSAPKKFEGEKSYDHIQLDDDLWCVDIQTENLNQQPESQPEPIHIPTETELAIAESDRSEYLERAENCGVQLDAWLKRYCLTVSIDKLENAINALEQQTSNKNQARAKAKGRGETDIETNPRYQIKNPTNFLISALDKEWKPNTKSQSYTSNGSHREVNAETLRPEITPAYIKSKYKPHQWRDAAEHFGYTYDEVANAVIEQQQTDGKNSLLKKIKELSEKFRIP